MKSSLHINFINKNKRLDQEFCFASRDEAEEAASLAKERFGDEFSFIAEDRTHQTYLCDFCNNGKSFGRKQDGKDICHTCYEA